MQRWGEKTNGFKNSKKNRRGGELGRGTVTQGRKVWGGQHGGEGAEKKKTATRFWFGMCERCRERGKDWGNIFRSTQKRRGAMTESEKRKVAEKTPKTRWEMRKRLGGRSKSVRG